MTVKEKMTAPIASVGADVEQPLQNLKTNQSIADLPGKGNLQAASYGKTGQLLRVSGAAVPFRTVRSTAMLARSATGEVNTVIYLYPAC